MSGWPANRPAPPPRFAAHTFPMPFRNLGQKDSNGHQPGHSPSIRHVPPQCYDPKMKYRSRMHYYTSRTRKLQQMDPDSAALLLDLQGNVTETGGANFLIVERGTIVSPTLVNTLPGISRDTVISLAGKLGIPFVERDIQVYNVINADEAFTTTTPYCIMPVTKIQRPRRSAMANPARSTNA